MKNAMGPPRLNILQERPPSCEMYAPVMSQDTRTRLASWGLMVGRKIPPPPPGPITSQLS